VTTLGRVKRLTGDRVRATFNYVPESGRLIRVARGRGARVGVEIGHIVAGGYRRAPYLGGNVMTSHLVWIWHHGSAPAGILTHINGDPADDRIENLAVKAKPINVIAAGASLLTHRQRPEKRAAGIYEIVQIGTDRRYVGSATDLAKRWRQHLAHLERGQHHSVALQRAWNKHGPEAFGFRTLIRCDRRHLIFYEQRAIDVLRPKLNCAPKAGSQLGYTHTAETIGKMKAAAVGRPSSFRGRRHSTDSLRMMSENRKGKGTGPYSAERIANTAAAMRESKNALNESQVRRIREMKRSGAPHADVAREIGCSYWAVADVVRGKTFAWVNDRG
jgi:group I intron endonuclease